MELVFKKQSYSMLKSQIALEQGNHLAYLIYAYACSVSWICRIFFWCGIFRITRKYTTSSHLFQFISWAGFPEYQEKEKEKENNKKKGQDYSETKLEEKNEKKNMIGCTRWNLTSFIGLEAYLYKMPQSYKKKNKAR